MELYLHDLKVDNRPSKPKDNFPNLTVLQAFCADSSGSPVYVEFTGFLPWMYVQADDLETFKTRIRDEYWYNNVKRCEIVQRQNLVGFTDGQKFDYLLIEFSGIVPLYSARKKIKENFQNVILFESSVDPILKFFHQTKLMPSSYFKMEDFEEFGKGKTHCDKEYTVHVKNLSPVLEDRVPPALVSCAFDIESSGLNPELDFVFQVSMCFSKIGDTLEGGHASSACKDGFVICVGDTESIEGTPLIIVENEKELLKKFRDMLIEKQVFILMGYNNYQFDFQFMYKRAVETYSFEEFRNLGFIKDQKAELREKTLESSALGRNELKQVIIPGRIEFDGLMVLRRSYKLSSYKLKAVAEHFFPGETGKDDVTYADIVEACTEKDPHKLGVVAAYCYQDSYLVLRLIDKIKEVYDAMEMAKLCRVPLTFILDRGQQIKCMSLILDRIYGEYVCNYVPKDTVSDEKFQGATVISAKKGFHKDPVVVMDFASLYPSIIQAEQLCYTTYIDNRDYLGIEGVEYNDYEISPGVVETFAHRPGTNAIIPGIERDLGNERKATKRLMKNEKDTFKHSLLNSKQLAQKVTMNSLYGFCGTKKGMLPLVAIAAAVTCTGRKMIEATSSYATEKLGCDVVYGDTDSVFVKFKVPDEIREQGEDVMMRYLFQKGIDGANEITKIFKQPILLEFENIYWPLLLVSKKRYAAVCYETAEGSPKMTAKGLVTTRRDSAPIVKKVADGLLDRLMNKKSVKEAVEYVKEILVKLEKGEIPIEDLTIRKELKKHPEEYASMVPHGSMAGKMKKRTENQKLFREIVKPAIEMDGGYDDRTLCMVFSKLNSLRMNLSFKEEKELSIADVVKLLGNGYFSRKYNDGQVATFIRECEAMKETHEHECSLAASGIKNSKSLSEFYQKYSGFDGIEWTPARLGERVEYVIIQGSGDVNSRVESPELVKLRKNLKIDLLYYFNQQLKNPIVGLLEHVVDDPGNIFDDFLRRARNVNAGRSEITSFFTRQPVSKKSKVR